MQPVSDAGNLVWAYMGEAADEKTPSIKMLSHAKIRSND